MARASLSYLKVRILQDIDTRHSEQLIKLYWAGNKLARKQLKLLGVTKMWRAHK